MATLEECEQALHTLAGRLAASDPPQREMDFDRRLSCTIRDLGVVFAGRLADGRLVDLARTDDPDAQVRLSMNSDDLIALVAGDLKIASAWATGRLKVDAGVRDLMRLRSIF